MASCVLVPKDLIRRHQRSIVFVQSVFKCIVRYQILMSRLLFPPQLKKLLLSPPNVPAGLESHKDGSVHRHSSRNQHVKLARPALKVRGRSSRCDGSINSKHEEIKTTTHNRKRSVSAYAIHYLFTPRRIPTAMLMPN